MNSTRQIPSVAESSAPLMDASLCSTGSLASLSMWTELPLVIVVGLMDPRIVKWERRDSATFRSVCTQWKCIHDTHLEAFTARIPPKSEQGFLGCLCTFLAERFPNLHAISLMSECIPEFLNVEDEECESIDEPADQVCLCNRIPDTHSSSPFKFSLQAGNIPNVCKRCGMKEEAFWSPPQLTQLHTLDVSSFHGVSDRLLESLLLCQPALCHLRLPYCSRVTQIGVKAIASMANLQTLDLSYIYAVTADSICALVDGIPTLKSLNISHCMGMNEEGVVAVAGLRNLYTLSIAHCWAISENGMRALATLPLLQTLDISNCAGVSDQGIKAVSAVSSISSLDLSYCPDVSELGMQALSELTSLRTLDVSGCCGALVKQGVRALGRIQSLHTLELFYGYELAESLIELAGLPELRMLSLLLVCSELKSEGVRLLTSFPALCTVKLQYCTEVSDEELHALCGLATLHTLSLSHCYGFTNKGIAALASIPALKTLNMSGCFDVTEVNVKSLACMPGVQKLSLSHCSAVTDEVVEALVGLHTLRTLDLTRCYRLTDKGVENLATLPLLQTLFLTHFAGRLTEKGVRALRAKRPTVNIHLSHPQ